LSDLMRAVANETLAVAAPFVAMLHLISGFVSKTALRIRMY
jgi:hypothetical protein